MTIESVNYTIYRQTEEASFQRQTIQPQPFPTYTKVHERVDIMMTGTNMYT